MYFGSSFFKGCYLWTIDSGEPPEPSAGLVPNVTRNGEFVSIFLIDLEGNAPLFCRAVQL